MYINYIQCIGSCIIIRILKKLHTCTCTHTHTLRHTHTQTHIYTVHRHRHTDTHTPKWGLIILFHIQHFISEWCTIENTLRWKHFTCERKETTCTYMYMYMYTYTCTYGPEWGKHMYAVSTWTSKVLVHDMYVHIVWRCVVYASRHVQYVHAHAQYIFSNILKYSQLQKYKYKYRIAGNIRWVQNFVIFVGSWGQRKFESTKIWLDENFATQLQHDDHVD